jgi:hypothetical protein
MKEYFKIIGLSLIPTSLVYIGRSESFFSFLKAHNFMKQESDISTPQITCFAIGIFWAGLITPFQLASTKRKLAKKENQYAELLAFNKETYFKSIKETLKKHNKNFRSRIFISDKGFKAWWNNTWHKKGSFKLEEIKGISDPIHTTSLHFEFKPSVQGLVGKACIEKAIIVDCNVNPDNYNLTHFQKSKTSDVRFCSTAPIFNKKNEVVAVLAIDSDDHIQLNDEEIEVWKNQIIYYCAFVDKQLNFK